MLLDCRQNFSLAFSRITQIGFPLNFSLFRFNRNRRRKSSIKYIITNRVIGLQLTLNGLCNFVICRHFKILVFVTKKLLLSLFAPQSFVVTVAHDYRLIVRWLNMWVCEGASNRMWNPPNRKIYLPRSPRSDVRAHVWRLMEFFSASL